MLEKEFLAHLVFLLRWPNTVLARAFADANLARCMQCIDGLSILLQR